MANPKHETLEYTIDTQNERQAHENLLLDMEVKKHSMTMNIPTLPEDVNQALRDLQQPIKLFGENPANVRDRLRMCMARKALLHPPLAPLASVSTSASVSVSASVSASAEISVETSMDIQETKYTHGRPELIKAREYIAEYSLPRAKQRLLQERKRRNAMSIIYQRQKRKSRKVYMDEDIDTDRHEHTNDDDNDTDIHELDLQCGTLYRHIRDEMNLSCSQYGGDNRPISAVSCCQFDGLNMIVTGGWSGSIRLWDANSDLQMLGNKNMAHEDRIMGIEFAPISMDQGQHQHQHHHQQIISSSIDLTAKLWTIKKQVKEQNNGYSNDHDHDNIDDHDNDDLPYTITESSVFKGHQARLCKATWHPSGRYVGTTSFDHTWRLWDVETSQCLLLQDGHWKECYGIALNHPDGSLCSTTDFGGIVQLWDLRTGKSISSYLGHAKRVLCTTFSPIGFQLATGGDDGTIKIWDLRKRNTKIKYGKWQSPFASIPAHSKLLNQLKFDPLNGESLLSSSFDGTARIWSTRNWKMLKTLKGHEGKIMGSDFVNVNGSVNGGYGIVTGGFDKTIKLWT